MHDVFRITRRRTTGPSQPPPAPQEPPAPRPSHHELGVSARIALDRAWMIAGEAEQGSGPSARLSTTALLLALADLARADACPSSRSLELLREHFFDRWAQLATARAAYVCGGQFQEAPLSEASSMSEHALRTLRLARLLAQEGDGGVLRIRHLLGSLLMVPVLPEPTGAQRLLESLGVSIDLLRARCPA